MLFFDPLVVSSAAAASTEAHMNSTPGIGPWWDKGSWGVENMIGRDNRLREGNQFWAINGTRASGDDRRRELPRPEKNKQVPKGAHWPSPRGPDQSFSSYHQETPFSEMVPFDLKSSMSRGPPVAHTHPLFNTHPHVHPQPPSTSSLPPPENLTSHPVGGGPPVSQSAPTSTGSTTPVSPLVVPQPVKAPSRSIRTYHCRMCDQIYDNKSDLLLHSQQVHKQDPKPYKCPSCNKCFANSSYLSQHARIHSGIKPYKCQICERRFTQLCHLQQHIRTHTGEKPYKCSHQGCGKAFSQLSNLQSHSRSHMTDKPYRCNSCYKCFIDDRSLREHIPKHAETKHLKTHICRICGKSYTQDTYLARHMVKHQAVETCVRRDPPTPGSLNKQAHDQVPSSIPQQQDLPDIKPFDVSSGLGGGCEVSPKPSSAFMPLPAHQFPNPGIINSTMPSNFPFPPPRIPPNSLNSPLSHIPPSAPSRYFNPFEPISFPKRDAVVDRGMMPGSLLSLQQIKNFSTSHPVFPKSEPSSPVHQ